MAEEPAKRVARLQQQMHRLTQLRLTVLHRRQAALRADERATVAALDDCVDQRAQNAALLHRRLRLAAGELAAVAREIDAQAQLLIGQARRARQAEAIAEAREAEARLALERRQLGDIIDAALGRTASLPQGAPSMMRGGREEDAT